MWLTAREALDKSVCKLEPRAPAVTGEMGSRHRAVSSTFYLGPGVDSLAVLSCVGCLGAGRGYPNGRGRVKTFRAVKIFIIPCDTLTLLTTQPVSGPLVKHNQDILYDDI